MSGGSEAAWVRRRGSNRWVSSRRGEREGRRGRSGWVLSIIRNLRQGREGWRGRVRGVVVVAVMSVAA